MIWRPKTLEEFCAARGSQDDWGTPYGFAPHARLWPQRFNSHPIISSPHRRCDCTRRIDAIAFGSRHDRFLHGTGHIYDPGIEHGGILVTGPANVNIDPGAGVGIVGGVLNVWVDGTEFVDFTFALPAVNVTYSLLPIGDVDRDGTFGERILEAFAVGGASLGQVSQDGFDSQVSALFGNVPIERFRLTPDGDGFGVATVNYETAAVVLLPAALSLFAGGAGLLGLLGWRRRRNPAQTSGL